MEEVNLGQVGELEMQEVLILQKEIMEEVQVQAQPALEVAAEEPEQQVIMPAVHKVVLEEMEQLGV